MQLERLGVEALGFTLRLPDGEHDGLNEAKARSIIQALPPFITACWYPCDRSTVLRRESGRPSVSS